MRKNALFTSFFEANNLFSLRFIGRAKQVLALAIYYGAHFPLVATLSFFIGTSFVEEQQNEHYVQRQNQIYRL